MSFKRYAPFLRELWNHPISVLESEVFVTLEPMNTFIWEIKATEMIILVI